MWFLFSVSHLAGILSSPSMNAASFEASCSSNIHGPIVTRSIAVTYDWKVAEETLWFGGVVLLRAAISPPYPKNLSIRHQLLCRRVCCCHMPSLFQAKIDKFSIFAIRRNLDSQRANFFFLREIAQLYDKDFC